MGNKMCVNDEGVPIPPDNHFKCRYDQSNKLTQKITYYDEQIHVNFFININSFFNFFCCKMNKIIYA